MKHSMAICIPVWNRGNLLRISFDSLLRQLEGIDATIWLFDNGSDAETRRIVEQLGSDTHRVHKVFFPQNMGIPYVANLFAKAIREECDFVNYRSPTYAMIMDSDAYFTAPICDMLDMHNANYGIGLISGHDSQEHPALEVREVEVSGRRFLLKRKESERMITMIMNREEFLMCYPLPHYRNRDVDWELCQWNPNSMLRRGRGLWVACGYVLHLGIWSSSWSGLVDTTAPREEVEAVERILAAHGITRPQP